MPDNDNIGVQMNMYLNSSPFVLRFCLQEATLFEDVI